MIAFKIPIKNGRHDATSLATLHRSGDLTPVYVPDQTNEALRDLARARKDITTVIAEWRGLTSFEKSTRLMA